MGLMSQLFTVDELKKLTAAQIEILKDAIRRELRTAAGSTAFKNSIHQVYDQLTGK